MANARNFWRYFTRLVRANGPNGALQAAAQDEKNMNKAKRLVKREAGRQRRRLEKQKRMEAILVETAKPMLDMAATVDFICNPPPEFMDAQELEYHQRVFTQEDHKNVVELMKDTYNFPAGGTTLYIPSTDHEVSPCGPEQDHKMGCSLPQDARERLEQNYEQQSFAVVFGGATRDELRKAFSYAGIKGFRNAKRAEFIAHMDGHWTTEQRDLVYEFLIGEVAQKIEAARVSEDEGNGLCE